MNNVVGPSLKNLELCVPYDHKNKFSDHNLDCLKYATMNLESLRLSCIVIAPTLKWDVLQKLQNLEISGTKLEDSILREALRATHK